MVYRFPAIGSRQIQSDKRRILDIQVQALSGQSLIVSHLARQAPLVRWRLSLSGLKGAPTAGHFHGPAAIGANAPATLPFAGPIKSPMEGRATLTEAQAADLLAGRWYASIDTTAHPRGEIRGQVLLRE